MSTLVPGRSVPALRVGPLLRTKRDSRPEPSSWLGAAPASQSTSPAVVEVETPSRPVNRFFEAVVAVRVGISLAALDGFHGRVMALPHHQISRRPGRFQRFESPASTIVTTGSTIEVAGTGVAGGARGGPGRPPRDPACGPPPKRGSGGGGPRP